MMFSFTNPLIDLFFEPGDKPSIPLRFQNLNFHKNPHIFQFKENFIFKDTYYFYDLTLNTYAPKIKGIHKSDLIYFSSVPSQLSIGDGLYSSGYVHPQNLDSYKDLSPLTLAFPTADCVSVTLISLKNQSLMISHIHLGWKGYVAGFLDKTFDLHRSFDSKVFTIIHPGIFGKNYPCGEDVWIKLLELYQNKPPEFTSFLEESDSFSRPQNFIYSKYYIDLQWLVFHDLLFLGAQQIRFMRYDTFDHPLLPSYRAKTTQRLYSQVVPLNFYPWSFP